MQPNNANEEIELAVVLSPNAGVEPHAMVVEFLNALVAFSAMVREGLACKPIAHEAHIPFNNLKGKSLEIMISFFLLDKQFLLSCLVQLPVLLILDFL